jgi:hypothetical protein
MQQSLINAVEYGEPGDSRELQSGRVKHDVWVAIPAQLIEYLRQMGGGGQIELSAQTYPAALGI